MRFFYHVRRQLLRERSPLEPCLFMFFNDPHHQWLFSNTHSALKSVSLGNLSCEKEFNAAVKKIFCVLLSQSWENIVEMSECLRGTFVSTWGDFKHFTPGPWVAFFPLFRPPIVSVFRDAFSYSSICDTADSVLQTNNFTLTTSSIKSNGSR